MHISGNILLCVFVPSLDIQHLSICVNSSCFNLLNCKTAQSHLGRRNSDCANREGLLRVLKRENYINLKQFSSQEPATFFAVQRRYDM